MNDRIGAGRRRPGAVVVLVLATMVAACGDAAIGEPGQVDAAAEAEREHHDSVVLDSVGLAIAEIEIEGVDTVAVGRLRLNGRVGFDPDRVSRIGPRVEARVVRVAVTPGDRVARGQTLAVLESPEVGELRAIAGEYESLVRIARENHERELRLEEQGITSRREVLEAEAELRRVEASFAGALQRLAAIGAGPGDGASFALVAPFAGTVVDRVMGPGEMAEPADHILTVADLDRVWIELDIYERDLGRIAAGQAVDVTTAAYPGEVFPGEIAYVGAVLDPATRTVQARVEVANDDGRLRPGMFATAAVELAGDGPAAIVVPRSAVQQVEGRDVVFVPGETTGEFHARPVELGDGIDGGRVVVLTGLGAGDQIVTAGAFTLRSELTKSEVGEAGHAH